MQLSVPAFLFLIAIVITLATVMLVLIVRMIMASRRLAKMEQGDATAFMAVAMQDAVTRMRDQERALEARAEASERLSDQIIDGLPSGLLVTDRAGVPTRINPAAALLLGLENAMATEARRDPASLWTRLGPSSAGVRALVDECLASGAPALRRTIVIEDRHAPGGGLRTRHLGAGVSPLHGARGELIGAICLFTDLTAVVDLEEQLRLKDSLGRLGELTAGLAHEFRNGLATIHGYARLMVPDKLPDDHRQYVESLRAETESLSEIVANFLAFAKPSAHTAHTVALGPIVTRAAADLAADAAAHGGEVVVDGEFGDIEADDVMLRQALSNLVRNAIEACADVGTPPRVRVRGVIDRAAGLQRIFVSDNGPGVPADVAGKVFRPFFTTRGRGTGLGLALVQKIIVSHNGRVTLDAPNTGGAEFAIILPLAAGRN
jgi:signal transduction histidine kinase